MTELQRLQSCFDTGQCTHPLSYPIRFTDFCRSLSSICANHSHPSPWGTQDVAALITPAEQYVLILVDGMGIEQLKMMPRDSFLRKHLATEMTAVFPSTTACALTTLATLQWPGQHAVPGWWSRLPEKKINATSLLFTQRESGFPLTNFGILPEEMYPVPSAWGDSLPESLSIIPIQIVDSVYSRYARGGTKRIGYDIFPDAFELLLEHQKKCVGPSFTYLYLPELDTVMHSKGPENAVIVDLLSQIELEIERFVSKMPDNTRVLITADHGQVSINSELCFEIKKDDPLQQYLAAIPSGEASVPIFHIKKGCKKPFKEEFLSRFSECFVLLSSDEVEKSRLYGPDGVSPVMKRRLGDFIAVSIRSAKMYFHPLYGANIEQIGSHGSISNAEMIVPLIVI